MTASADSGLATPECACAEVTLAAGAADEKDNERTMRAATNDDPSEATAAPEALRAGTRVLVVDDNADAADMLASLLEILEADVRVAYDGRSALQLLESFKPEAIVLDLGMPVMDGFEVARRVRASPGGERIALVALSGWGQDKDREMSAEAGFDVHLVKPVDIDRVLTVLRGLDAGRRT